MLDLYLLVIGQDQAECEKFDRTNVDCELHLVSNSEDRAMAAVANEHLRRCERRVFGLVHPDCAFGSGGLRAFYNSAMAGNACGIVGCDVNGNYHWCNRVTAEMVGDIRAEGPGPVSTLDDCAVFFRPRPEVLAFDEKVCSTFYAYVTELCLQAHALGIPVVVPFAVASHPGKRYFTEYEKRQLGWNETLVKVRAKWSGVHFRTT